MAPDPGDETRRILAVSKSNLGALPPALAYRVEGDAATGAARIAWEGATAHPAADLLATPVDDEERGARDEAHDFLAELLVRGPLPTRKVKAESAQAGLSWATVRRLLDRSASVHGRSASRATRNSTGNGDFPKMLTKMPKMLTLRG